MTYQQALDAWRRLEASGYSGSVSMSKDGCTGWWTLLLKSYDHYALVFCGSEEAVRKGMVKS